MKKTLTNLVLGLSLTLGCTEQKSQAKVVECSPPLPPVCRYYNPEDLHPHIDKVIPNSGYNDIENRIIILGADFMMADECTMGLDISKVDYPEAFLETSQRVSLGNSPLSPGYIIVSARAIGNFGMTDKVDFSDTYVVIPSGVIPGTYGITVVNKSNGESDTLTDAFTVEERP